MKSQIGCTNDAKLMKRKHVRQPFLSLFKIMPTEGEIEKFIRLQKKTGFPMLNQNVAAAGKKIDQEDIKKAEQHPGRLVSPTTLNALAGIVLNQSSSSGFEDETDRTYLDDGKTDLADVSPDTYPGKKQQ